MKQPIILYIAPVSPPFGGLANQTHLLSNSSLFRIMNFCLVRSNPDRLTENPGTFKRLFSSWPLEMRKHISKCLSKQSPDIVLLRVNGDISFFRNAWFGLRASKISHCPLIIHMHASRKGFWHSRKVKTSNSLGLIKETFNSIGYKLVSRIIRHADAFSQLTTGIDQYFQSIGLPSATHIIPNAVIVRDYAEQKKETGRFMFIGRLSKEKGFFDLLEALEELAVLDWNLDVLGSPTCSEDEERIQDILSNHPFKDRIHLHGTVKGDERWKYFDRSSFLVLPTYLEVFPNAILEAMATGQAVISTPVGEIEGILPANGREFINPGDIRSLRSSIESLLISPKRVKDMGKLNYQKVKEYDLENVAGMFKTMILDTLTENEAH